MFFWGELVKVLHEVRTCKAYTLQYDVTNVTIYAYFNVIINKAYYDVIIYVYFNVAISFDITLLRLFDVLLIAVGV